MKQFLSILIAAMVATTIVTPVMAADKPAKQAPKKIKKHKKAEASGKVADDKPKAPAKKK
jgi:hypothetical protein